MLQRYWLLSAPPQAPWHPRSEVQSSKSSKQWASIVSGLVSGVLASSARCSNSCLVRKPWGQCVVGSVDGLARRPAVREWRKSTVGKVGSLVGRVLMKHQIYHTCSNVCVIRIQSVCLASCYERNDAIENTLRIALVVYATRIKVSASAVQVH